ncbi:DoxX family protein [Agromyces laixinhei]|uniref:DoxX family protein n=1 Tax=Agromyces laixinhei TaxID=2585717 RepID=UPI00111627AB|nr:DoxX family protein [Agromyces laixinhei]
MDTGKLVLRLFVGGLFMGHGLQKLTGWFGGPGIEGTEKMMEGTDIHPPRANAYAVALTETAGGAAIAAGAATPLASAGLIATMLTAIDKVHWKNGFWNSKGGWEFNGTLIATLFALSADGPGKLSIDAAAGRTRWGIGWGVFALVAGAAGAYGVVKLGERNAPAASGDR